MCVCVCDKCVCVCVCVCVSVYNISVYHYCMVHPGWLQVYVADARRLIKGLKKSTVVVKVGLPFFIDFPPTFLLFMVFYVVVHPQQLKEGASASEKNTFLKPVSALK